ncbi:hypothetical protein [Streptomyces marincola]|uniref:DUF3817 domain-containing protein n=1 Tax=Streptomyces marincola TaxID=2878388 RepID=A0A1W7CV83_9ACTN|nr:hypothetical protein [Streptomyces marincola]ARQ68589.1 hypothetical protein CAG99_06720 [Streptomyces marincola]
MRALRVAAAVEAGSLAALLLNLFTVHAEAVSSLLGPLHGTAYLVTVVIAWPVRPARFRALVPGVGGLLAARHRPPTPPA